MHRINAVKQLAVMIDEPLRKLRFRADEHLYAKGPVIIV